jgi:hypothetical protein
LPCCLCGAGIEKRGDRVHLDIRPHHMDDFVIFWTHRRCLRKAMRWRSWVRLRMSGIYGN